MNGSDLLTAVSDVEGALREGTGTDLCVAMDALHSIAGKAAAELDALAARAVPEGVLIDAARSRHAALQSTGDEWYTMRITSTRASRPDGSLRVHEMPQRHESWQAAMAHCLELDALTGRELDEDAGRREGGLR